MQMLFWLRLPSLHEQRIGHKRRACPAAIARHAERRPPVVMRLDGVQGMGHCNDQPPMTVPLIRCQFDSEVTGCPFGNLVQDHSNGIGGHLIKIRGDELIGCGATQGSASGWKQGLYLRQGLEGCRGGWSRCRLGAWSCLDLLAQDRRSKSACLPDSSSPALSRPRICQLMPLLSRRWTCCDQDHLDSSFGQLFEYRLLKATQESSSKADPGP